MLDLGIIRPSKGSFSIEPFTKGRGNGGACSGYRSLNAVIKPDPYSIPHIHDITAIVQGKIYLLN